MESKNNIYGIFAKYVSLNILSMVGLSCYILADTYFIANGIGSIGVTALNIALPIYSLINGIGLMLGMGAATKYSILRGSGSMHDAYKIFTHTMLMGFIFGIILTLTGIFFSYDIVHIMGADKTIAPIAEIYLKTLLMFSCAFIINNILICFVRNDNCPKLAMFAMLAGSLSNIILDYIFIFPFKMGMFGAALATIIAPIISISILIIYQIKNKYNFHLEKCHLSKTYIFVILSLGFHSFITEISAGITILIFNFIVLKLAGNTGVAAYGIIANLALVVTSVFTGIAQGMQPIISINLGLKNSKNIKQILYCSIALSLFIGVSFYVIGFIFPEHIVSLFNKENNTVLSELAINGIHLYFMAFLIMGVNITSCSFFASISQPAQSFAISIIRGCGAVIPLALLLSYFFGMTGIWITVPCSEIIAVITTIILLMKHLKKSDLQIQNSHV